MSELSIRPATVDDAAALRAIYAPYVERTAITFEYEVPSVEEFACRIARTLERYPYLVAERDGRALGYAYASAFHPRAAYDWCSETAIYVSWDARQQGVGGSLYRALEHELARMGIRNLYACVSWPRTDHDSYLTADSITFHEHEGFATIGHFHECGYKFGRWYDMVWMEKHIGAHGAVQPVVPHPRLAR